MDGFGVEVGVKIANMIVVFIGRYCPQNIGALVDEAT